MKNLVPLNVRLVQMCSGDDPATNVKFIDQILENSTGFDLILFPENSLYLHLDSGKAKLAHSLSDPVWGRWAKWCENSKTSLLIVTPMKEEKISGVVNATVLVNAAGAKIVYRKIHLFDVDVVGEKPNRESDSLLPGQDPEIIEVCGWKIGLSICYDLRFAELFLNYAKIPVDIITVPAAFLVPTGMAHWPTLLRARAIESQCFVVAPAQAGVHGNGNFQRSTFGHSLAVGPWGDVLADSNLKGPDVMDLVLDPELLRRVRTQIPMAKHRRLSYNLS